MKMEHLVDLKDKYCLNAIRHCLMSKCCLQVIHLKILRINFGKWKDIKENQMRTMI